jgi:hypothetical protein
MSVNRILVFQFPKPTIILKHTLLLESLHTLYIYIYIYKNMN